MVVRIGKKEIDKKVLKSALKKFRKSTLKKLGKRHIKLVKRRHKELGKFGKQRTKFNVPTRSGSVKAFRKKPRPDPPIKDAFFK